MVALGTVFTGLWNALLTPIINPVACLPERAEEAEPTNTKALLQRLEQQLQIRLKTLSPGEQRALRKGDGLDFAELREYHPGDDLRKMDWNVFARTTQPHIREYHAETQAIMWIAVDISASMQFGRLQSKAKLARELAGLLGILGKQNRFRVGGVLFGGAISTSASAPKADGHKSLFEVFAPTSDPSALQGLLARLLVLNSDSFSEDFPALYKEANPVKSDPLSFACERLDSLINRGSSVFLISDFLSWPVDEAPNQIPQPATNWQHSLGRLAQKAQVVTLPIFDPVEAEGPTGIVKSFALVDSETGKLFSWPGNDPKFSLLYKEAMQAQREKLLAELGKLGACISASTEQEAVTIVMTMLSQQSGWRRANAQRGR